MRWVLKLENKHCACFVRTVLQNLLFIAGGCFFLWCVCIHALRKRSGCGEEAKRQRQRRRRKNPVYRNMKVPCGAFADFFFFFYRLLERRIERKNQTIVCSLGGFLWGFFFPPSPLPLGTAAALQTWIRSWTLSLPIDKIFSRAHFVCTAKNASLPHCLPVKLVFVVCVYIGPR